MPWAGRRGRWLHGCDGVGDVVGVAVLQPTLLEPEADGDDEGGHLGHGYGTVVASVAPQVVGGQLLVR